MSVTSGFFDSVDGDRKYDAEQMTNYFEGLVSDGIYQNIGDAFVIRATGEGLNITVGTGRALCKTHWIKNDAAATFTLSPANVQNPRIDSVFLRYSSVSRTVEIVIVEGTPGNSPVAPQPTRSETVWDLFVGSITVASNATVLTQSAIHDYRGSSSCPWVTGLIKQVDTSELFLQYETAYEEQLEELEQKQAEFDQYMENKETQFNNWFSTLTQELSVNTSLHEYQSFYEVEYDHQYTIPLNIPEYEDTDIVMIFLNGIHLRFDKAHPLRGEVIVAASAEGGTIQFGTEYSPDPKAGDEICAFVIKSQIGDVSGATVSHVICTQAEYDAMTTHDENTIYIIKEETS